MIDAHKGLRVAQAMLLAAAALTGLAWFEDTRGQETEQIGEEALTVATRAPVQNPKGPWTNDTVFTEAHAGIPLGVAPTINVTATYQTQHLAASDHGWTATLRYEATGEGGGTWWSITRPVALNTSDTSAYVELDLPRIVQKARSMTAATDVPARLSLTLAIHHEGTVVVDGDARQTRHTTTVDLVPREGFVVPQTHDDGSTYARPVEAGLDRTPIAFAGVALLAEGPAFALRRRREPWEGAWGVDPVEVDELEIPPNAPRTDLKALLSAARDRDGTLLVDRAAGLALAPGDPPLTARLDAEPPPTERPALPDRPPVPGR